MKNESIPIRFQFKKHGIFLFLLVLFLISSFLSPAFLTIQNIRNILTPAAALGIVSIGQTFVILMGRGNLDLSVGSVVATVAVILSQATGGEDFLLLPVTLLCLLFGVSVGWINGYLITQRGSQPFIATLGVMIVIQGLRFLYTQGAPKGTYPPFLRWLGTGNLGFIPISVVFVAIFAVGAFLVLNRSIWGRKFYATGGNIHTSRLSGFNTDRIVMATYMLSGCMATLAGFFLAGWLGISDNWVGKGYEIDSIAAVVMGGTTFEGGRGGVGGTMAGVFILIIIYNLLLLLHLPIHAQYVVKGLVIILAVSFYVRRSSR
jgi:ribose transport system permease protein/inositol transport system permease protein